MSAQTAFLLAAGYLGILVVVLAILAAAGRADREADRLAREAEDELQGVAADARSRADADRRFGDRRTAREIAQAGGRTPPPNR